MRNQEAFFPVDGSTVTIAATNATQNIGLPTRQSNSEINCVSIANTSAGWAYVKQGTDNTITVAASTGMPIAPGTAKVIKLRDETTFVACILSVAGPSNVHFTQGVGL